MIGPFIWRGGAIGAACGRNDRGGHRGYLGWQHFSQSSSAPVPKPIPSVPVIAATVEQCDFPILLTGIGNVTALNTVNVGSMVAKRSRAGE